MTWHCHPSLTEPAASPEVSLPGHWGRSCGTRGLSHRDTNTARANSRPLREPPAPRAGAASPPGPDRARSPRSATSSPAWPHDPHALQCTSSAPCPAQARPPPQFPAAHGCGARGHRREVPPPPRIPGAPDGATAGSCGSNRARRVERCPLLPVPRAGRARSTDGAGTGRMRRDRGSGPTHRERDGGKGRTRAARGDGRAIGGQRYREISRAKPGPRHWLKPRAVLPERRRRPASMATGTLGARTAAREGQKAALRRAKRAARQLSSGQGDTRTRGHCDTGLR